MKHKDGPHRQCVSCRRVFPKGELLRFVCTVPGETVFDERQNVHGRGFYLCPDLHCFRGERTKKRTRALWKDGSTGEMLCQKVVAGLLVAVEDLIAAGPGASPEGLQGSLETGALLLVSEEKGPLQQEELLREARESGAQVFMVPGTLLRGEENVIITKKSPKISPLLRNLRLYERLSSKGRAL